MNIDHILKREKISKVDLAKRMDVSREYLYRILDGNPTLETLEKLAKALGVPVRDLFPEEESSITCPNCGKKFVMEDSHIPDHKNIRGKEYYK
ncbi:helix-turn-helix domain-containing protein [Dysgonomonas capnocytophagoides]|uniref:Helix-turn-helix domain-containing protein n=1 Tax=Dysgonomonas capnocytophagoides TaxID=45254 RepID=A0A4Y8L1Y8_9BACT|nr:helix-turn-helix domain-containing protein [Dysgonomonas capnocytophagoides]TFD96679.1 helix-turn-helix domain-containing protein [Dysgonomonas capnocytophagoides]